MVSFIANGRDCHSLLFNFSFFIFYPLHSYLFTYYDWKFLKNRGINEQNVKIHL